MKLNKKNDAYGKEILAELNGEKNFEIIEREDGYFDISGGSKNYFSEYKLWPIHEKNALKFVKGKILDIGVGAGRIALYFQKKGFDVTGIDNSIFAIEVCKKRGLKKVKNIGIEQVDKLKEKFDTIILAGNNFGLFCNKNKTKKLLKKLYKITNKNAVIIAESNDPYKTKDKDHLVYGKWNRQRGKMTGQLKIRVIFKKTKSPWFEYLIVSKKEMKDLLKNTGWSVRKFINSKNNSTYIAIIEKDLKK